MGKCCLRSVIGIVLVIAIIVIAAVAVLNMTPAKLGFADTKIMGEQSLRDLGFADTSIWNIIKSIKSFAKVDEKAIVTNGYDTTLDKESADSNLANSNLPKDGEGNIDYVSIASGNVIYDNEYLFTYSDTTIAYIFHSMITSANSSAEGDSMKYLRDINADISEVTITKDGENTNLRIVVKIDLSSLKTKIKSSLGGAANLLPIPDKVFIVSYSTMTATDEGIITTTGQSIKINDTDNAISAAIFRVLANEAEDRGAQTDTEFVNGKVGAAFSEVISHLGKVGIADVDTNGIVIASTKQLGAGGIFNHSLKLITNTAANTQE